MVMNTANKIILASQSTIRRQMLEKAGVNIVTEAARIDEASIRDALLADGVGPRDIADALAEAKARKVSGKNPGALIIGCDQVLEFDKRLLTKPTSPQDALDQLTVMNGRPHKLLSAAVIYLGGEPQWRHVGTVRLTMRSVGPDYLQDYVDRNWDSIRDAVGCYKLEEEGVRLFSRIDGDYFTVLGLPLTELLGYLTLRGTLPG